MRKNFFQFANDLIKNFGEATINIFIFLPYFFSVGNLIKTLFAPWKNLINKKSKAGFTLSEWGDRFFFNMISRGIGFVMRFSIISFYFIFQAIFMILLPFIALIFFCLIPIFYLEYLFQKTEAEKKEIFKSDFISKHLIKDSNVSLVESWFEKYYEDYLQKQDFWQLKSLFEIPPLARDWAFGYTPTLDLYTTDLATPSYLHHLKNIIGREKEIVEIEQVLSKSTEANVIIVGDEGVGKHTIVDALAKKIYLGNSNIHLIYKRILKLNMEKIKSDKPNIFQDLLLEAKAAKNIILFIDNMEKNIEYSDLLSQYGKNNSFQVITITNPFFYQKYILTNDKLNRFFNKVDVREVNKNEALEVILDSSFKFEKYHNIIIPYETILETVNKSEFYLTYIPFPEKAVDLLDNTCVYAKNLGKNTVSPEDVDSVLTEKTHIPTLITSQMKEKLINLEELLKRSIVQQEEAINKLSSSLRRSFLLLGKRKKPLASFLFLGPTGVGKTETAKAVAQTFFSSSEGEDIKYLIRFDMSQYQSKLDIPKLIGDSVYHQPGQLSSAIRQNPYGVLLLDEIEKADHDLLNIFLTILDEGYFTDGEGRRVDCKNLVIIATSNAGAVEIFQNKDISILDYLIEKHIFSPEFLNRYDGVVVFKPLSDDSILKIAKKMIEKIISDIKSMYKINVKVSDKTLESIVKRSKDSRFGARNLDRVIRDEIEDKISKLVLEDKAKEGSLVLL